MKIYLFDVSFSYRLCNSNERLNSSLFIMYLVGGKSILSNSEKEKSFTYSRNPRFTFGCRPSEFSQAIGVYEAYDAKVSIFSHFEKNIIVNFLVIFPKIASFVIIQLLPRVIYF